MDEIEPRPRKAMLSLAISFNLVAVAGLIAVTAYIVDRTFTTHGNVLFAWHPTFMSIGYLIVMAQGITAMADNNVFTHSMGYQKRVLTHWILQATALVLITIGQSSIFINKVRLGKSHYQSTHSILGLITFLLTILTACGGVFTKYSFQLRKYIKPLYIKMAHSFIGIASYVMACTTISFGIYSRAWKNEDDAWVLSMLQAVIIITTPYVIWNSTKLLIKRTITCVRPNI